MVLTRRAHKAISRWLPNETITEIVQAAPRSDQASLCRVSKLFRDLCLPILYRVVELEADASVADFGATVLSNAALTDYGLDAVENIFVGLKAMIPSDVPFICSNDICDKIFSAVVDSLSRNLPHTRTLQLCLYDSPAWNEVIGHLKNCLPRFTGLAFLSVHNSSWVIPTRNEEEEINVLGDACSTLEVCRLDRRAWRKVDGMWETYPLTDFDALAGLESWTL
ncbi:hypothetical protein B0H17DRAFT_1340776 [Mycena rosella]|uniref:F-box domain-containing protein n=1 Tax=Mycena rosella TaxID=1033263 RepID=A0AAD7BFR0_MYCRO|nr:hypothetical protein B0H17DRAFT_1340776 [Mycena rosella]